MFPRSLERCPEVQGIKPNCWEPYNSRLDAFSATRQNTVTIIPGVPNDSRRTCSYERALHPDSERKKLFKIRRTHARSDGTHVRQREQIPRKQVCPSWNRAESPACDRDPRHEGYQLIPR